MSGGTSSRITELIWRTDNRSAIRGLKEISDQANSTTRSMKKDADEQAAGFRKVEESSSRLRDSFMGLAGMVGIGGVAFGLRDLKDSAVALQANDAQLRMSLQATGQAAGNATDRLEKMAESLSTKGGFGTTENLQALTQFVRETHSATRAQQMLTLATNIARGRNMDLASAQQVVARAYTGNVSRLQQLLGPMVAAREAQVGLTTAHQQEIASLQDQSMMMGKMGSVWLRQQEINDHLTAQQVALAQMTDKRATAMQVLAAATKAFGGSTAAYSKTTAGMSSNLTNSLHNLTEELGTALLPAMNWLIKRGATVAGWMAKNKTAVLLLVGAFGALGAAMGIRKVIKDLHGLGKDIAKVARRLGIMGAEGEAAGAEVSTGATEATTALETTAATGEATGAALTDAGVTANIAWKTLFTGTIIGLGLAALMYLITHFNQVKQVAVEVWHTVTHAVTSAWHDIEQAVAKGAAWIWNKLKWLGGEAVKVFSDTPLGGLVNFGSSLFSGHVGRAFGGLAQGFTGGIVQSNGSVGIPYRNLWQGSSSVAAAAHGIQPSSGGSAAAGGNVTIHPAPVSLRIDGREVANATIRYALNRAARGPSSLIGGSLVTGAPGLPVGG